MDTGQQVARQQAGGATEAFEPVDGSVQLDGGAAERVEHKPVDDAERGSRASIPDKLHL